MSTLQKMLKNISPYQSFLHIALIVLCYEVYTLAGQNEELKADLSSRPSVAPLQQNEFLALDELRPLSSNQSIDSTGKRQLIFVFTTSCPYCKKSTQKWNDLASHHASDSISVFGISLDDAASTLAMIDSMKIQFPVFIPKDEEKFKDQNHIRSVPYTIIRGKTGFVEMYWRGLLTDEKFEDLVSTISDTTIHPHSFTF